MMMTTMRMATRTTTSQAYLTQSACCRGRVHAARLKNNGPVKMGRHPRRLAISARKIEAPPAAQEPVEKKEQEQPSAQRQMQMQIVDDRIDLESTIVISAPEKDDDSSIRLHDSLLVLIPGALKPPTVYRAVCEKIQRMCASYGMRLWVVIPGFVGNLPMEKSVGLAYAEAIKLAEEDGFEAQQSSTGVSDRVYVAGHSWGGATARPVGFKRARALICLASCIGGSRGFKEFQDETLEIPQTLLEWHKPVLTVAGELDGQFRIPYAALQWKMSQEMSVGSGEPPLVSVADKSVVVIEKMNHAQFCDGEANIARGDIDKGIGSLDEGLEQTARVVSDFLLTDRLKSKEAASRLMQAVDDTGSLVKAYIDTVEEDVNIRTAVDAQVSVSQGILDQKQVSAKMHRHVFDSFVYSKAETICNELSGNEPHVRVHCWEEEDTTHIGGHGNSRNRASPLLWLKLRSLQHLMEVTNSSGEPSSAEEEGLAGMESNERMLKLALEMVGPDARERYEKYGRKIRFLPDHRVDPGPPWLDSPVKYSISSDDGALEVSCPFCSTPTNIPPRFAGMFYVKVMSLGLVVEYILVDAFCAREALQYISTE